MKSILFNTDMVCAILDGKKSVIRVPVKPQPNGAHMVLDCNEEEHTYEFMCGSYKNGIFRDWSEMVKAPYWPGDTLWVRETWAKDSFGSGYIYPTEIHGAGQKWNPSSFMPREAARIFLKVISVYPERLTSMILDDVEKEGLEPLDSNILNLSCMYDEMWNRWIHTWNSSIKPIDLPTFGWDADPWVWVVRFERISKEEV